MKTGQISIMDARVIQAKHHHPNKGAAGESTQATEAGYNVKQSSDGNQKTTDGYKAHRNVEEGGFISKAITTAGFVHDSQGFAPLLTGEGHAVYADSADASEANTDLPDLTKRTASCLNSEVYCALRCSAFADCIYCPF